MCAITFAVAVESRGQSSAPWTQSLPVAFERNDGQAPGQYRFVSRHGSVDLFLKAEGADLILPGKVGKRHRIALKLLESRPDASIEGRGPLPGVSNYLSGSDSSRWKHDVPNLSEVAYRQLYPGIDLVFRGRGEEIEHDFRIAPGHDPSLIHFAITGADGIALNDNGDLDLSLSSGTLLFKKPATYQETAQGRRAIESRFALDSDGSVRFRLGKYDPKLELVIDPVFVFSTYLAGSSGDWPVAITTDASGNVYVTGYTNSTDFPMQNGIQETATGGPSIFVSKLDPTGHTLLYSTYLGGSSRNYGNSIAVDAAGNIIVAGTSASNDFPHAGSVPALTCDGNNECFFLVSLKPDGSSFNYAGLIGGKKGTSAQSGGGPGAGNIAVDAAGNTYLAGVTDDSDFVITPGTLSGGVQGGGYPYDSTFIMKVNATGAIVYSTIVPGVAQADNAIPLNNIFVPSGISVDANGQAAIAGTAGPGLPGTAGVIQPTFPNDLSVQNASAGFALQINATASAIKYATYVTGTDSIGGYAVDSQGNSYLTGGTSEPNLPVGSNAYQKTLKTGQGCTCNSGFILKLNGTGTSVLAATYLEGTPLAPYNLGTKFMGLTLDSHSNVFVGGITGAPDFPLVNPFTSVMVSNASMVMAGMSSDLSSLIFGSFLSSTDQIFPASTFAGITVDHQNHLLVLGQTSTTDFPTTPGSFQPTPPAQAYHAFITSFDMSTPAPSVCLDSWSVDFGTVTAKQSKTQVVHLTNCGNAPLPIPTFEPPATVVVNQSCGSSIPAGAVCALSLVYTPIDSSTLGQTLVLTDTAQIPTQVIQLNGQGVAPKLSPSSGSFNFGDLLVNTVGAGMPIVFSNPGNAALTISSVSANGDFSISQDTCTGTMQQGGFCILTVVFAPTAAGIRTGTLTIVSDDPVYPQAGLSLVGTGDSTYALPLISYLNSPTAQIGNGPIAVYLFGANFYPASTILANGVAQPTTYVNGQELQATLSASVSSAMGEIQLNVSNPTPGGGVSVSTPLALYQVLNLDAIFLTSVPGSSLIYASIPASAPTNPNTVIPINPATGALGTPIPVGNNPGLIAPSSDGSYLYVVANQDQTVQRINLSTNAVEKTFPFPPNNTSCCGALAGTDLKGVPGAPTKVVLAVSPSGYPFAEMALYDDTGLVNYVPTSSEAISFSSFAYAGNPTTIYALPFTSALNPFFNVITINAQGLQLPPPTIGSGGNNTTGATVVSDGTLLYTSAGEVWNPATQTQVGTFPVTTYNDTSYPNLYNITMDTASGHIFVLGDEAFLGSSSTVLSAYRQQSLSLSDALSFPQILYPSSSNLIRWGTSGFAFIAQNPPDASTQSIYLLTSSIANPAASNPVPALGSLFPGSVPQGSADVYLALDGQNFVDGAVVKWNGAALQTTYVSSTVLNAVIPASNFTNSGTASVTVSNPTPGGGNSNALSLTIAPLAPLLSFSSSAMSFSSQQSGTSSSPLTVAVQNPGTATLTISSVSITGSGAASFQQTNTCGTSLAAGANCALSVVFAPNAGGSQTASLTFVDNAADSPQSVSLSGNATNLGLGTGSGGSTSATVTAGGTANYNLAIGGLGTSGTATITCTGAPKGAACSVSGSVVLSATSPSALPVTVTTTARTSAATGLNRPPLFWAIAILGLFVSRGIKRKAPSQRANRLAILPILAMLLFCSCGGGGRGNGGGGGGGGGSNPNGTPAGTYMLTVTATVGSSSQALPLTLTVQ